MSSKHLSIQNLVSPCVTSTSPFLDCLFDAINSYRIFGSIVFKGSVKDFVQSFQFLYGNSFVAFFIECCSRPTTISFFAPKVTLDLTFDDGLDIHLSTSISVDRNYIEHQVDQIKLTEFDLRFGANPAIIHDQMFHFVHQKGDNIDTYQYLAMPATFMLTVEEFRQIIEVAKTLPRPTRRLLENLSPLTKASDVSIPKTSIQFCHISQNVKKPSIIVNVEDARINLDSQVFTISFALSAFLINWTTRFRDTIISPIPIKLSFALIKGVLEISCSSDKTVYTFLSPMLAKRINLLITTPEYVIPNVQMQNLTHQAVRFKSFTLEPNETIAAPEVISVNNLTISLQKLTYPLFISPNWVLSPSNDFLITLKSPLYIDNNLDTPIKFFYKATLSTKQIEVIPSGGRYPASVKTGDKFFFSLDGNSNQTFQITPDEDWQLSYPLNSKIGDVGCVVTQTTRDIVTITISPGFEIVNELPIPINAELSIGQFSYNDKLAPNSSRFLLVPYDVKDLIVSRDLKFSLKQPVATQQNYLELGQRYTRITTRLEMVSCLVRLYYHCDIQLTNKTGHPIELYHDEAHISTMDESLLFLGNGNYFVSLSTVPKPMPLPLVLSHINYEVPLLIEYTQGLYMPVRLEHVVNKKTHVFSILPAFTIMNELDESISIIITAHQQNEYTFEAGVTRALIVMSQQPLVTLRIAGYADVQSVFIASGVRTILQFVSDDRRRMVQMSVCNHVVRFGPVTEVTSVIVNELCSHSIYVNQIEDLMPLRVLPQSTTILGFDVPFETRAVVVTLEGVSQTINIKQDYFNQALPFKMAGNQIFVNVKTLDNGARAIIISNEKMKNSREPLRLAVCFKAFWLSLLNTRTEPFFDVYVRSIKLNIEPTDLTHQLTLAMSSIHVAEHLTIERTFLKTIRKEPETPAIKLICNFVGGFSLANLRSITFDGQQVEIRLTSQIVNALKEMSGIFSFSTPNKDPAKTIMMTLGYVDIRIPLILLAYEEHLSGCNYDYLAIMPQTIQATGVFSSRDVVADAIRTILTTYKLSVLEHGYRQNIPEDIVTTYSVGECGELMYGRHINHTIFHEEGDHRLKKDATFAKVTGQCVNQYAHIVEIRAYMANDTQSIGLSEYPVWIKPNSPMFPVRFMLKRIDGAGNIGIDGLAKKAIAIFRDGSDSEIIVNRTALLKCDVGKDNLIWQIPFKQIKQVQIVDRVVVLSVAGKKAGVVDTYQLKVNDGESLCAIVQSGMNQVENEMYNKK